MNKWEWNSIQMKSLLLRYYHLQFLSSSYTVKRSLSHKSEVGLYSEKWLCTQYCQTLSSQCVIVTRLTLLRWQVKRWIFCLLAPQPHTLGSWSKPKVHSCTYLITIELILHVTEQHFHQLHWLCCAKRKPEWWMGKEQSSGSEEPSLS